MSTTANTLTIPANPLRSVLSDALGDVAEYIEEERGDCTEGEERILDTAQQFIHARLFNALDEIEITLPSVRGE